MLPVLLIIAFGWGISGVVTSVKTHIASRKQRRAAANSTPQSAVGAQAKRTAGNTVPGTSGPEMGTWRHPSPDDVTFGQWQASVFRRWKLRIRSHLPGQRLGRRAVDLVGDITAASIAGAAIFGMGFASGTTWMSTHWAARHARDRTQRAQRSARPQSGSDRQSPLGASPTGPDGFDSWADDGDGGTFFDDGDWHTEDDPFFDSPRRSKTSDGPIDAELTDDITTSAAPTGPSRFASNEYADLVGQPELLAHNPTPNGAAMATEILTIHQLFAFAQQAVPAALEAAEQATIRKNSALGRAEQAAVRGKVAVTRAEKAVLVAATAREKAAQLEEMAARFSGLNVDSDSLAAIYAAIEAMNLLAQREEAHAEAEAQVAADAERLAQDEQIAAAAAEASAQAAIQAAELVQGMHDVVQAHQMPHAEAQAATGNAAAHESVLAAG